MQQECGRCVYLDTHDKKEVGDWFNGYHDEYKCTDKRKYVGLHEGKNCRYFREAPQNQSSGCFITTVVVNVLKHDDNCKILSTLRRFRDDVLTTDEDGLSLLRMYDVLGPQISECISNDEDKLLLSYKLFANFIAPAAEFVKKCDFEKAKCLYVRMVHFLQIRYNICLNYNNYVYDDNVTIEDMGHGTARVHKVSVKS